jgi:hypothetical protein
MNTGIDTGDSAQARWIRGVVYVLLANAALLALLVALQWRLWA